MKCGVTEMDVNKSGSCYFEFSHVVAGRHCVNNFRGQLAWIRACGFGQAHRDISCEVSMTGIAGTLDGRLQIEIGDGVL